ncbi:MAG TPA: acetyl-CoA carboxylase biotin carboxylase subunit [Kiritimatiellia bacterium]|nr:acetyl-CoA carboxylase biotin carboxylase subunit [Kiritimatiellia bacterium]HRZ11935.1 acetyl-CoA carboxylase biotin carboxylase subunit [Kiritimatiellia bacterium]HSA17259.1 acetyl-CoA carboxylase biotin carboxylase subunit [Kiritimatiellia bacterium]
MFERILIANRGEIALRIIRACREMGIKTVAVHSEADESSLHVQMADESVCIGPAPAKESYLKIANIISAAEVADVDAIHPGYGFLSENAHFAEICENCKITFIGPSADNIRMMGDKAKARETMKKAGVPVTPGSEGVIANQDEALKAARQIGYPVLIKAVAGGGGKGMRIARNDVSLVQSFMTAASEAERAFGNPEVYIEKFVEKARHIEVQVFGDHHGNVVHLGERDCSLQRRHQKLIEESPSPAISPDVRKKLTRAAVRGAEAVKYRNAGTIEFLFDVEASQFYFMEMNTRIQVEHPVTEEVAGVDLIKEQISVAAGNKLSFSQKDLAFAGHAIEVRINAENPYKNFTPSPGRIQFVSMPGGPGVRVDSHVYTGYEINPHYDSMIGKIIVRGRNRAEAIAKMTRALSEFVMEGPATTVPLCQALLGDTRFARGEYTTAFLESFMQDVFLITP